jgi:hypothetical protein
LTSSGHCERLRTRLSSQTKPIRLLDNKLSERWKMSKNVTVLVHDKLNLEQCQKVLAAVLTKAGHTGCFSGLKISFENVVDPANLALLVDKTSHQVNEIGR